MTAPAKYAHGAGYWIFVGWWWEPICWLGRMILWIVPPLGAWRSVRKGQRNREARMRRGV